MSRQADRSSPRADSRRTAEAYDGLVDGTPIYPGFFAREYMNFGFWHPDTASQTAASQNLMHALAEEMSGRTGPILDVACGLGATTRYLTARYASRLVIGINLSVRQIGECARRAPHGPFVVMDAAALAFKAASFDDVVCVEAAFHFVTRKRFLADARLLLKPGGRLVLSDMLLTESGHALLPYWHSGNFLDGPDAYSRLLSSVGFRQVRIRDITDCGIRGYLRYMKAKIGRDLREGICTVTQHRIASRLLEKLASAHAYNIVCTATA